jgi:predicted AlkP superfamily pyrophosphatase or phosphodiesterase
MHHEYPKIDAEKSKDYLDHEFYDKARSIFTYNGDVDEVGHLYSASKIESQFIYGQQLANAKSFYQDYLKKYKRDNILFVVMSDHGTYDYKYELELTNHGYRDKNNTAFAYLFSSRFAKSKNSLYQNEEIHISQLGPYLSMFLKNCSIPI